MFFVWRKVANFQKIKFWGIWAAKILKTSYFFKMSLIELLLHKFNAHGMHANGMHAAWGTILYWILWGLCKFILVASNQFLALHCLEFCHCMCLYVFLMNLIVGKGFWRVAGIRYPCFLGVPNAGQLLFL